MDNAANVLVISIRQVLGKQRFLAHKLMHNPMTVCAETLQV